MNNFTQSKCFLQTSTADSVCRHFLTLTRQEASRDDPKRVDGSPIQHGGLWPASEHCCHMELDY